jgi:aryl-alcohol dehydrogenase-like predicted oxidoreductase
MDIKSQAAIAACITSQAHGRCRATARRYARGMRKARVHSHAFVLATEVHGRGAGDDAFGTSRHIIQRCEASLSGSQTDYSDLCQIHRPESDAPIDETLRALDDLIRSGKVRYIGTSTFGAWQMVESLRVAKELGLNRFVSEQPP